LGYFSRFFQHYSLGKGGGIFTPPGFYPTGGVGHDCPWGGKPFPFQAGGLGGGGGGKTKKTVCCVFFFNVGIQRFPPPQRIIFAVCSGPVLPREAKGWSPKAVGKQISGFQLGIVSRKKGPRFNIRGNGGRNRAICLLPGGRRKFLPPGGLYVAPNASLHLFRGPLPCPF